MNERELLELAANAANTECANLTFHHGIWYDSNYDVEWNPLTDDGDALRLAVKLGVLSLPEVYAAGVFAGGVGDEYAVTRRAIVRAAAEIGKSMK